MKNVTIYSTPNCKYCVKAKEFFDKNKVSYKSVDVASDPMAKAHMIERSGQLGVPVIIVGQDVVVGFNQKKLEELLDIR